MYNTIDSFRIITSSFCLELYVCVSVLFCRLNEIVIFIVVDINRFVISFAYENNFTIYYLIYKKHKIHVVVTALFIYYSLFNYIMVFDNKSLE